MPSLGVLQSQLLSDTAEIVRKTDVFDGGRSGAMRERRESGEDKREFEELLKRDRESSNGGKDDDRRSSTREEPASLLGRRSLTPSSTQPSPIA